MKNLSFTRDKFHKLIDEIDSTQLLEHFYILLSDLTNNNLTNCIALPDNEYNFADEINYEEN